MSRAARTGMCSLTLVAAVFLVACTGDGDSTPSTTAVATTTTVTTDPVPGTAPLDALFVALAGSDATALIDAAADLALPGSDADWYARHQSMARTLVSTDGSTGCVDPCPRYSGAVRDAATGLVSTFSVDDIPLAGRVAGGGLTDVIDGIAARIATGYVTETGALFVVVEVENTTAAAVEVFGFGAVHQAGGAAGATEATGWWGPDTVPAGSTATVLLRFGRTIDSPVGSVAESVLAVESGAVTETLSGRVLLSALRSDGIDVAFDLTMPTSGGVEP